jgi:lipopolysaccharide/colanic/teichoic acid biosynthesis glycosyltransferase
MLKRIVDIACSALALAVLGPAMIALAVWVRSDSPGEPIFRQRRAGWRGRPFTMLKFRTMRPDVNPYGVSPHGGDDPRLTRAGRFLRETSLDELPQLWNVLRGEMSLVGPRPLYERQAAEWDDRQGRRLDVRPGLTGYAQVVGRASLPIEDKIELDLEYIRKRSFTMDLKILLRTVTDSLARKEVVYEQQYSRTRTRETDAPQGG